MGTGVWSTQFNDLRTDRSIGGDPAARRQRLNIEPRTLSCPKYILIGCHAREIRPPSMSELTRSAVLGAIPSITLTSTHSAQTCLRPNHWRPYLSTRRAFIAQTTAAGVAALASGAVESGQKLKSSKRRHGLMLNLGIVGVGDISPRYFTQAAASSRARFVATCARHLESAKARAAEYGIKSWFDDYNAMYDSAELDGVVVATPNSQHAGPAIAALERGIAVLCEKPMATSWADCQAMVRAAQRNGTVFLALPYDATPPFLEALKYLDTSSLGVFTGAESQLLLPGPGRDNWYYDKSVAGGAMLDSLVYPTSALIGMLGPARRVTGFVNTLIPHRLVGGTTVDMTPPQPGGDTKVVESNVDDNVTLVIEWAGGQQAVLRTLWGTSLFRMDCTVYGRDSTLWLSGSDLIVHSPLRPVAGQPSIEWHGYTNCYRIPVRELENEGLVDHFADCINKVAKPNCGGEQQLHVHEILFKGYDAARTGIVQQLETTFVPWHSTDLAFMDTRSHPV